MRALTLTACVVLFAVSQGEALAASGCGKGMLWPYVRQPGDCLTDEEIKAGQRGVYNGPVNTNPDMSGVRVETPTVNTVPSRSRGGLFSRITGGGRSSTPTSAPTITPTNRQGSDGPSLNGSGFSTPAVQRAADAPCTKGWLWPFVRKPGECLTGAERENGQTGVYRADQIVASASPAAGPGVTQISAPGTPVATPTPAGGSETPTATAEPACTKGWLWPFVRKRGDCPTDAERGRRR